MSILLLPVIAAIALAFAACTAQAPSRSAPTTLPGTARSLVLISLDGFRTDYLDWYRPPTLLELAAEGVRADALIPSFPTKTFPNHYTLVTGHYPASHGIVGNTMWDPVFETDYTLSARDEVGNGRWYEAEPIWAAVERRGWISATYFWPGSEAEIDGIRPTHWRLFDDEIPGEQRIDTVLDWLARPPGRRPAFVSLYFSDVDSAGHDHGPRSVETAAAVERVDAWLGLLVRGLDELALRDAVDLMIVSDHGMAATSSERAVALDRVVELDTLKLDETNPIATLWTLDQDPDEVATRLRSLEHVSVWTREQIPPELHYSGHRRIPDLVVVADEGWSLTSTDALRRRPHSLDGGTHGYLPTAPSMAAVFVANGPSFRRGLRVPAFENVHVYELMCSVLGIEPAPNQGDLSVVEGMLRASE